MAESETISVEESSIDGGMNMEKSPQTPSSSSGWSERKEIEDLGVRCVGQEDLEAQLIQEAEAKFQQELISQQQQQSDKEANEGQPSSSSNQTSGNLKTTTVPWEILDSECEAVRIGEITPFERAAHQPSHPAANEYPKKIGLATSLRSGKTLKKSDEADFQPSSNDDDESYESEAEEETSEKLPKRTKKKKSSRKEDLDDLLDDGDDVKYRNRLERYRQAKLQRRQLRIENELEDVEDSDADETELSEGFRVPNKIWANLHKYQRTGVRWLLELHRQGVGGILGDEMGLGKTVELIAFVAGLAVSKLPDPVGSFRPGVGPILLICPATILHQWVMEFHNWFPQARVAVLHGSGSFSGGNREALIKRIQSSVTCGVLITTYAVLTTDYKMLQKFEWNYVVLDEGHKIRNPDAQVTLAAKQFRTPHRLILSGSPVQNSLKELWSIFDFVYPGRLGTLPVFMQEFAVPITQGGYANAGDLQIQTAYKCACILKDAISPYLLRRLKADVQSSLQLPLKNEQVLFCRLTESQRKLYRAYLSSQECDDILTGGVQIFVGLTNLRKICNHTDLVTGPSSAAASEDIEEDFAYGDKKRSGKLQVVDALLKLWKRQGHRVLLFSQTRQMLDILEMYVQKEDFSYMRMDGNTSIGSRQGLINRFNSDAKTFLFLLSTRVGGVGLNLTGADRVIIFDPDWNPATDTQARERAWRIGQNKAVTIYRLLTSGTIEEKIYQRQVFKQFLTNRVLKDPRQRRFFKSNDLHELFTLIDDEGLNGTTTETGSLFNADVKMPKKVDKHLGGTNFFDQQRIQKELEATGIPEDRLLQLREIAKRISQKIGSETSQADSQESLHHTKDSSGKLSKIRSKKGVVEGHSIPYVARKESFLSTSGSSTSSAFEPKDVNKKQDDYVLSKLLKSANVHSALQHDVVVDSSDPDYYLVHAEADKIAKAAAKALAQSRRFCPAPTSGLPSWTGRNGVVKKRFGRKSAVAATATVQEATTSGVVMKHVAADEHVGHPKKRRISEPLGFADLFGTPLSFVPSPVVFSPSVSPAPGEEFGHEKVLSSAELLSQIGQRQFQLNFPSTVDVISQSSNSTPSQQDELGDVDIDDLMGSSSDGLLDGYKELIGEIRMFVAYDKDGRATTKEIVEKFGDRLPAAASVVFKAMLKQICSFERDFSSKEGVWHIRPQFR